MHSYVQCPACNTKNVKPYSFAFSPSIPFHTSTECTNLKSRNAGASDEHASMVPQATSEEASGLPGGASPAGISGTQCWRHWLCGMPVSAESGRKHSVGLEDVT